MNRASLVLAALLVLPLACADTPPRAGEQAKAEDAKPEPPVEPAATPPVAKPGSVELTPEELELIAADPAGLTPEQNRKRAYALRKKIMQNPESETAKALEDARAAALSGELTAEQIGTPAEPSTDPGLVIELPEHLKSEAPTK